MMETLRRRKSDTTAFSSSGEQSSSIPPAVAFEDKQLLDPRWEEIMTRLISFYDYEDDWDGMEGVSAESEVIDAAIFIATTQRKALHPAPDAVSMTCNGTITFETAASETESFPITTLEVLSATEAELFEGGETLKQLEITCNQ